MNGYEQIISERLHEQDEREFALGDTFDIKTSIALVIITFLATQSADFLKTSLSVSFHRVQIASVICIVGAGILTLFELFPRKYRLRMAPDKFLQWVDETKKHYGANGEADPVSSTVERIHNVEIETIKDRIASNSAINEKKSRLMEWSFYFVMAAVILNLSTLIATALVVQH